jgi:hypothetical protein
MVAVPFPWSFAIFSMESDFFFLHLSSYLPVASNTDNTAGPTLQLIVTQLTASFRQKVRCGSRKQEPGHCEVLGAILIHSNERNHFFSYLHGVYFWETDLFRLATKLYLVVRSFHHVISCRHQGTNCVIAQIMHESNTSR